MCLRLKDVASDWESLLSLGGLRPGTPRTVLFRPAGHGPSPQEGFVQHLLGYSQGLGNKTNTAPILLKFKGGGDKKRNLGVTWILSL